MLKSYKHADMSIGHQRARHMDLDPEKLNHEPGQANGKLKPHDPTARATTQFSSDIAKLMNKKPWDLDADQREKLLGHTLASMVAQEHLEARAQARARAREKRTRELKRSKDKGKDERTNIFAAMQDARQAIFQDPNQQGTILNPMDTTIEDLPKNIKALIEKNDARANSRGSGKDIRWTNGFHGCSRSNSKAKTRNGENAQPQKGCTKIDLQQSARIHSRGTNRYIRAHDGDNDRGRAG